MGEGGRFPMTKGEKVRIRIIFDSTANINSITIVKTDMMFDPTANITSITILKE